MSFVKIELIVERPGHSLGRPLFWVGRSGWSGEEKKDEKVERFRPRY